MRDVLAWALCALLLAGLGGCAGPRPDLDAPTETEVAANLRTAFDYLYDNYHEEIRLENVVIPGLENLRVLEPDLTVTLARVSTIQAFVEVRLRDELIYRVHDPAWYAGDGWSAVVRNTIKALRTASPRMADASWVETTDLVLVGVAAALGENGVYLSRPDLKAVGLVREEDDTEPDESTSDNEPKASAGIRLHYLESRTLIAQVRRNSAAAQAGLRVGDIVETLEGQPAATYSRLQMDMQFVGPPGSEMKLTVRRADEAQAHEIALQRETVDFSSPVAVWRNGLLYLQITSLWGDTTDAVEQLLRAEHQKGAAGAAGIILDLRGTGSANPYAAARFLDIFNDGDERYFRTEGKNYLANYSFRPRERPIDVGVPLVVLANGETAGAAEAMVAALQNRGRAVVLGSATQGHGRLQGGVFLLNGGFLAFTQSILFQVGSGSYDGRGVLPMVCADAAESVEAAVAQLKSGKGILDRATRTHPVDPSDIAAIEAYRSLCPPHFDEDETDMALAEAILKDPALYEKVREAGSR